ncbi:MAG: hypothetical protein K0S23_1229 [Fluviicola sp.]|jgi:hypothetical protein|uniref:hypothetical protein n=1 Tax=Fluviicola sp. TaxID=1917219 RepID=UPI00262AD06D|nr:hypothetical protein [Fluviicola sp.]MDF3026922.1 hypothetical protein [Fluviicola sp.]
MNDFLAWSGWAFGLISTVIAVFQFRKKEELKKEVRTAQANIDKVVMEARDKGVAININNGDITIS